jgi:diguanylate cyclase (GGDEF)-like protein
MLACFLSGLAVPAWAAQLNMRHYDTRDGIPQIQVTSVHQDPAGYLWIGTYGGLAKYNGESFEVFRGTSGLNTSYINVVDSGADRAVWVGTSHGLCRSGGASFECFNPRGLEALMVNDLLIDGDSVWTAGDEGVFRWRAGGFESAGGWPGTGDSPTAHALAIDATGAVWVGAQAGLFRLGADGPRRFELPVDDPAVHDLTFHEGALWAGTRGRLFRVSPESGRVENIALPVPSNTRLNDIEFDREGRLWIATPDGLVRGEPGELELLTTRDGLPNNRMLGVTQDREGLVWVATDQGLVKILPGPFEGYSVNSGLVASFVRTINEDERRRLWLGTREGLQIVPYRDGRWRLDQSQIVLREDGLPDARVYSVAFESGDVAWIATAQGVVRWREGEGVVDLIDRDDGLPAQEVHALLIDRSGRLWISSTQGIRFLEEGSLRSPRHGVLAGAFALRIRQDEAGRLWFSTLRDGLLVLEPDGALTQYTSENGLTDEMLWDLAPAADGSMWVGSNGDGIFRVWFDGRIDRISSQDGLADDSVWQVLEDDQGRLWAYTNRGLSRMDGGRFVNYTERDGLLHLEGGATGAFQSSDGMLWFASADGLMRYDAEREYRNRLEPPMVIESVRLDQAQIDSGAILPYRSGSLAFRYAGLSFQDEAAVRFRYRLVGASAQWSEPTRSRQVTYANLGHGDYRFEVVAANPDGVWSETPAAFSFRVATPFWANAWFIALVIAGALVLVALGVHLRLRRIEATRRALQETVDRRTAELSDANRRLQRMARTDQLTGLPNRRYLFDRIGDDVAQSRRAHFETDPENGDIAFLMIDLDAFKQINDRYGHDAGDRILLEFSKVVGAQLRDSDYMIRWGGEEFLVVACQTETEQAGLLAERLLRAVRKADFTLREAEERMQLTCSIGIACYPFTDPGTLDWEQVVELADVAVYRAKANGRNGWVQLTAGAALSIGDVDAFLKGVRGNLDGLIANGRIVCREQTGDDPHG